MALTIQTTPKKDGFRMPAEFESHKSTWLMWPDRTDIYPYGAKAVQKSYVELAAIISKFEQVNVCVSKSQFQNARVKLPENVRVMEMSYDGGWIRDTGPTFLTNDKGTIRGVDWEFNSWGEQGYFPWDQDNLVAQKVLEIENIDRYKCNLVLEGGSLNTDGQGTLLITEESVINPNRNPSLSKFEIEELLTQYLNVKKIIWLEKGIYLDEAGGHIDGLCCFLKPQVIALTWTEDKNDPQYEISRNAYDILSHAKDSKGNKLEIVKMHQPDPCYITKEESAWIDHIEGTAPRNEGDRLPATYINFYFANNSIIFPTFNDKFDKINIEKLKEIYPERQIMPIFSRSILLGGGNIHCMTQQQPKA